MGQGPQGPQGPQGLKGDDGKDSVINYSTLSTGLIADNTFKESVKNTIITNASLFKGVDGRGVQSLRITNGTLVATMTDNNVITAQGEVMGPAGKDGRGIKRVDFNNQNGNMTVVLEGTDANTDGPNFTTTTNFGENLIRGKTLWCADGQVCQIPTGNAYIHLPVRNTGGGNAQSQVLRVGNWEIGQNSAGSLQFTNFTFTAGSVAGTTLETRGSVFTMNTAGTFEAGGDLRAGSGRITLTNDWTINSNDSSDINFYKGRDWRAIVNKDGDVIANRKLDTRGGELALNNNWNIHTAGGNMDFRKGDSWKGAVTEENGGTIKAYQDVIADNGWVKAPRGTLYARDEVKVDRGNLRLNNWWLDVDGNDNNGALRFVYDNSSRYRMIGRSSEREL